MNINQLRQKFLDFYQDKGHAVIPSASLIPENDPTTLFTGSGMQPLVPYLLGQDHPSGSRLVDSQKCFRAEDIEEVGDNRHTTFFEMLGNWSLGDYFKRPQLSWFFTFLTEEVGLDPRKLYVTVFSGDQDHDLPRDSASVAIWKELFASKNIQAKAVELLTEQLGGQQGMQGGRIFYYDAAKNWWSRAGAPDNMPAGEPGGPDSEVFYEFTQVEHDPAFGKHCHPNCDCGRFLEIGNSVFMQYLKTEDGFEQLPKQNVDFGGGLERILAAQNDNPDVFTTSVFHPIIDQIEAETGRSYQPPHLGAMRTIADHLRAAVFMIAEGLEPSNKGQGYLLRRLLRRSAVKLRQLKDGQIETDVFVSISQTIYQTYQESYFDQFDPKILEQIISKEINKFVKSLDRGLKVIDKHDIAQIDGQFAFDLFQTYGFPFEITQEILQTKGHRLNQAEFETAYQKHKEKSRSSAQGKFKGGLAEHSETTTQYHTATHLLHAALRQILGDQVRQEGSNITAERLRFDFSFPQKLTDKQLEQVNQTINQAIQAELPVTRSLEAKATALRSGALSFFKEKYPDQVSVYTIGDQSAWFSKELCGGPHVDHTGEIPPLEIYKQESIGAGKRRIYARFSQE